MISNTRTAGRYACLAALGLAAATLAVGLAACARPGAVKPADCVVRYSLQVTNDAADRVRVRVRVPYTSFSPTGTIGSGVMALESGAKLIIEMFYGPIGCEEMVESNKYIALFSDIEFFDQRSDDPYRSYAYLRYRCLDRNCNRVYHLSSDETWQNLFMESPDRPFYLERDGKDPDLARIVITYVPSAKSGFTSAVE